jgi:hypothetical protein
LLRKATITPPAKPTEQIMTLTSLLRSATLALSLVAATGALTASAFAAVDQNAQQQQQSSPYDSPNFTIPENNIQS